MTFGNFHLHSPNKQITNRNPVLDTNRERGPGAQKKKSQPPFPRDRAPKGAVNIAGMKLERRGTERAERGWEAPRVSYRLKRARFWARACDILSPFALRASFIKRLYRVVHFSGHPVEIARLHTQAQPSIPPVPPSRLSQAPNPFLTNIWTPRQRAEDADLASCRELGPADLLSRWPRGAAGSRSSLPGACWPDPLVDRGLDAYRRTYLPTLDA